MAPRHNTSTRRWFPPNRDRWASCDSEDLEHARGSAAATARPRWLMRSFSASGSSAVVRPSGSRKIGSYPNPPSPRGAGGDAALDHAGEDLDRSARHRPGRPTRGRTPSVPAGRSLPRIASTTCVGLAGGPGPPPRAPDAGPPAERGDLDAGVVGQRQQSRMPGRRQPPWRPRSRRTCRTAPRPRGRCPARPV